MIFSAERIDKFMAEEMLMDRAMYKKVKAVDRESLAKDTILKKRIIHVNTDII